MARYKNKPRKWGAVGALTALAALYKNRKAIQDPNSGVTVSRHSGTQTKVTDQIPSTFLSKEQTIQTVKARKRKRRLTPSQKKQRGRYRRFKSKVRKVFRQKGKMNCLNFRVKVVKSAGALSADWNTTPCQSWVSPTTSGHGVMWCPRFLDASADMSFSDIAYIQSQLTPLAQVTNTAGTMSNSGSNYQFPIYISYAMMTLSLKNLLTVPTNIDIYEFVAARDMAYDDLYSTPDIAWNKLLADNCETYANTGSFGTAGNWDMQKPDMLNFGWTPLDVPGLGKHWKLKQKSRIYLNASDSTSLNIYGPKGIYNAQKYNNHSAIRGKTTMIYLCVASEIGFGATTAMGNAVQYAFNKNYHWRSISPNQDLLALMPGSSISNVIAVP